MCAPSSHHQPPPQNDCLVENTSAASDAASAIGAATDEADWAALHASGATKFKFSRVWSSDVVEAKALAMFAYMLRATRVLEVRTRHASHSLSVSPLRAPSICNYLEHVIM